MSDHPDRVVSGKLPGKPRVDAPLSPRLLNDKTLTSLLRPWLS
ncbi:MAG: hypothetical protein QGD90_00775 [Candidatus Hydrogenedentes bacterium]|nr:hypothetical protein [Candidatus Hydrogenedentota bacterium]